ncbi:MAG: 6-bladed beta-propeller [Bacteroidia bacterium]|nr:MAG: 6-bladed beta-propeller [Bacteroidia bacterium]
MKKVTIYLILFIIVSCVNRTDNSEVEDVYNRDLFFFVDYEQIIDQEAQINLSELVSGVEYVRLETNDSCLLHRFADYHFTKDFIFVDNVTYILQFDREGNFIKQIGKPGRGPGEIGLIRILSVLDDQQLLVVQTNWARKLYYFSYVGEFIESVKISDAWNIVALPEERLLLFEGCVYGQEEYMFLLTNSEGDTTDVVLNHYKWENKTGNVMTVGYHLFYPFYRYNKSTHFKSMHNDTVYFERGDSITPEYLIDLGKYTLPQEYRPEVLSTGTGFNEKSKGYRFATSLEANNILFIASQDYSTEEQYNIIYNRPEGVGNLLIDKSGSPSGLMNNFDGGLDFWPKGAVDDNTLFMPILPHQIIGDKNLAEFSGKETLDPEKKKLFLEMVNSLSENDNPILMIVKLK